MEKLPLITSAFLNLTNSCNLACRYCFVEQEASKLHLTDTDLKTLSMVMAATKGGV